jgi:proline-specific peptidase
MRRRLSLAVTLVLATSLARGTGAQLAHAEPEWYLPTGDGCRLFVQEYGSGRDTVIVVHGGFGAEHSYLLDAFRGLEERFHFVFYDQRGSLRSPCPDSLISAAAHVRDVERLRQELKLERATLVAHSMGTRLAMQYLQEHPDRLRGMVLAGAIPPMSVPQEEFNREGTALSERPVVAEQMRLAGLGPDTSRYTAKERTTHWRIRFTAVNVYHVERWRQMRGGQAFYSQRAGSAASRTLPRSYDFRPAILAHPCPVWIVIGDHDYVDMGARRHRKWTPGIAHVTLRVLEKAGHAAWIDAPEAWRESLGSALGSMTRCRP